MCGGEYCTKSGRVVEAVVRLGNLSVCGTTVNRKGDGMAVKNDQYGVGYQELCEQAISGGNMLIKRGQDGKIVGCEPVETARLVVLPNLG